MNRCKPSKTVLAICAVVAAVGVAFFGSALSGRETFSFRDGAHYYYPLFRFVAAEWWAGRVPLWNPYENLGVPLAGNAPSSAFYPAQLIFLLPVPYAAVYAWYIVGHVFVAAWAAYWLARRWRRSRAAATVAALSYAFGGIVLYQYCNVIFLVGAAWLPLGTGAAERMLRRRSLRSAIAFGGVLAMMTLGGDPQAAYHAALLAAAYALLLWWRERQPRCKHQHPGSRRYWRPALLAVSAATGLGLAAVQIVPSVEFTRASGRRPGGPPRTVYELPAYLARSGDRQTRALDVLAGQVERGTHQEYVYHFSVGPWRLAELVWPNVGGRQFPVHRRWLSALPAEGRVWVPSLYMGAVPLVLALSAWRCGRSPRSSWMRWLTLLAIAGSFGWYGLGWWIDNLAITIGSRWHPAGVGPPFGGLYWLMTLTLPGYVYFRYPAKLLVVAALGLSMMAAAGFDAAFARPMRGLKIVLIALVVASALALTALLAFREPLLSALSRAPADVLFGPINAEGAARDLMGAFAQTALTGGVFLLLIAWRSPSQRWRQGIAVLLVACDLVVANRWMIATATATFDDRPPRLAAAIDADASGRQSSGPYRVYRRPVWTPQAYASSASVLRTSEAMQWDYDTLWPKYNLLAGVSSAEVYGTMMPYDYERLLTSVRRPLAGCQEWLPDPAALAALNCRYIVLRGRDRPRGLVPVPIAATDGKTLADVSLWRNPDPLPRAWVVHRWISEGDAAILSRPADDCHSVGASRQTAIPRTVCGVDLASIAVVEDRLPVAAASHSSDSGGPTACRIAGYAPDRVEIEVELEQWGIVVLADQYYPGWRLSVETDQQPAEEKTILRVNWVMRGALLPAGRHRLVFVYRPFSFYAAAAVSLTAWGAIGIALAWSLLYRRNKDRVITNV